jgi:hypothetical protein
MLIAPTSALAKPVPVETENLVKAKLVNANLARYSGQLITDPKKPPDKDAPKQIRKRAKKATSECLDGRVVTVFHRGVEIARTLTNEDGSWSVTGPVPPAGEKVDVIVSARRSGLAKCLPDIDEDIPVLSKVV